MMTKIFRLKPGADLKHEIESLIGTFDGRAAYIITCVGGLGAVKVRMAGATPEKQDVRSYDGHFEIVSLVGTLAADGAHLHLSFSDPEGIVRGGHLKDGCIVNPTAEIVIGIDGSKLMSREPDADTGFDELVVREAA